MRAVIYLKITVGSCLLALCAGCARQARLEATPSDPCAIALVEQAGTTTLDDEIRALQQKIRTEPKETARLETLGWKFVAKARLSNDPGYYRLAESCAECLRQRDPKNSGAQLLLGHALVSLHHFKKAEVIARELVSQREMPLDFALLGDALMEQGRLPEAVEAYQKMADLKPGFQVYTRVAHMRWLTGDLEGAIEAMSDAVRACSVRDSDSLAWACSRLALYQLQKGETAQALGTVEHGLTVFPAHSPSQVVKARILLAQEKPAEALPLLRRSMAVNPLPETGWLLADVLRQEGAKAEAEAIEKGLHRDGAQLDPRSYALYLATRGEQPQVALQLAREELETRADVFTLDALAWALQATGQTANARREAARSLAEGTQDARLFFHAGIIAARAGEHDAARPLLEQAEATAQTLTPSERSQLSAELALLRGHALSANQTSK